MPETLVGFTRNPNDTADNAVYWNTAGLSNPYTDLPASRVGALANIVGQDCGLFTPPGAGAGANYAFARVDCVTTHMVTCQFC